MEELLLECLWIAIQYHVTDIHFSIRNQTEVKTEMRVQGVMEELKRNYDISFFYYLMYRANLDVTKIIEPQTGQFEVMVGKQLLSLRFSIVSSFNLISGVLRILNNHEAISIESLSTNPNHIPWFQNLLSHRDGLYIFSGPTGSGKTTSLYTILDHAKHKKIFTLEDPIEVYSSNYIQIQVNDRQLDYAAGIKQLMRHDPDVIMIGEIRDSIAAKMAVRTALTGHLVVTSLHASSCISAIDRLLELGVEEHQLKDVLSGISNQRLYDSNDHSKIGVYEIMDRKEVNYYFTHHEHSSSFVPLEQEIQIAVQNQLIPIQQAQQDFHGSF